MKKMWQPYADKINALSLRERMMVFAAVLAVTVFLLLTLFVDPLLARGKTHKSRMAQQQAEIAALQMQVQALEQKLADPDAANRARRDGVRQQIAAIDESLRGMQASLVPAQRVNALLQDMLTRNPRLQLVSVRTLPVSPLVARPDKPAVAAGTPAAAAQAQTEKLSLSEANVFKHGVEITLQGTYSDMHDYLSRLERLRWRMFWARARLNTDEYPRLNMTVTVYTLSLDKAWLQV